jgi:transcriptional regulator with XRE-family HTH domain
MKKVCKNFINVINHLKLSDSQAGIARKLGIQPQSLGQILKEKRSPTIENISKLFTIYKANPLYIISGQGSMFLSDNETYIAADSPITYETESKKVKELEKELNRLNEMIDIYNERNLAQLKTIKTMERMIELLDKNDNKSSNGGNSASVG